MRVSSRDWLRQFTEYRDSILLEHDDAGVGDAAIAAARAAPPDLAGPQEARAGAPEGGRDVVCSFSGNPSRQKEAGICQRSVP